MMRATMSPPTTPGELKSKPEASPAFFPALKASPKTTRNATPFRKTSVQTVELSRDFMPPSKSFHRSPHHLRAPSPKTSNAGPRKHFKQPAQVDDQRKPIVVPQHADAMRHVFGRLLEKIFVLHGIRSNHFVRRDSNTHIFLMVLAAQGSHHHVLRKQARPAALRNRDVDQRHN